MVPDFRTVVRRVRETSDVVTLELDSQGFADFTPGQFNMLYAFGVGEIPISISGDPNSSDRIVHTIRAVGPISEALTKLKKNEMIGVRGPYGSAWPLNEAAGSDVLVIAGGIGMAPLRPVLYHLLRFRKRYGRVVLLYGARSPEELLFNREIDRWRRTPGIQVRVTVDHADQDWTGEVGVVTNLLPKVDFDAADTVAMVCGPEVMIRFVARALEDKGMTGQQIFVSMERNMKCAIGLCGHCQFGSYFICKDGPVFRLDKISENLNQREI
ncbi:MAG: Ni/Fe hydrogenase subunit gamma [Candidatus Hydrogenedentota bacterium]|nr:MAG: Ni/Fe hydrogenase subunit gamma [Candidatus Hydrogenedentota bacterium]